MKLPNGYGSVYKLSGKRRKPWAARVTVGWNEKGQPIYRFVGYYKTKTEGLKALAEYNMNPYDLDTDRITLGELYEKWAAKFYEKASKSSVKTYSSAYKVLRPLEDVPIKSIKLAQLQEVFDQSGKNRSVLNSCKIVLGHIYEYAVRNEIVPQSKKDLVKYIDVSNASVSSTYTHEAFTHSELEELWERAKDNEDNMTVLILVYTGLRISEMLDLKKSDIYLENRYLKVVKSKTQAGVREVPIAEKIVPFFEHWLKKDSEYLVCNSKGGPFYPHTYRVYHWQRAVSHMRSAKMHTPHDARHTCISLLTEARVDPRIIKQIVGHSGAGVTEQVYTHISMEAKLEAINLI